MTDTTDVLAALRRGWLRLLTCLLLAVLGGTVFLVLSPTRYTANAYLVVTRTETGNSGDTSAFSQVFARLAADPTVLGVSPHLASIGMTPQSASRAILVSASPDAPILQVQGTSGRAFRAAEITNFAAQAMQIYAEERSGDTGFEVREFVRATPPMDPTWPKPVPILGVSIVIGLVLGTLAALSKGPAKVKDRGGPAAQRRNRFPPRRSPGAGTKMSARTR